MEKNKASFLEPELNVQLLSTDLGTDPTSGPDVGEEDWGLPEL